MTTSPPTGESIQQYVIEWISKQGGDPVVDVNATLSDIGLDSLAIVDLSQSLRREWGIHVPAAEIVESATLAETVDLFVEHIGKDQN
jgi:acyl carrier protein